MKSGCCGIPPVKGTDAMTQPCRRHEPDSLTGAILAIEGIRDAAVLLNGPTGCKFYHGAVAEGQLPRESSYDPLRFLDEFYFGQPRVPATYLDGDDYVFGATAKLERILPVVAAKGHALIAVINSPGAALIGDDLNRFVQAARLNIPCVAIESTGYSGTLEEGFQEAVLRALETIGPVDRKPQPRTVNLVGMSIHQKHWEGNTLELARLLDLCGVQVNTVLCAGAAVEQLHHLRAAPLNVMVHEECGDRLAAWCETEFGIETLRPCAGAPLGFQNTEVWIRNVCRAVGAGPGRALEAIDAARTTAVMHIKRLNSLTGLPKGATFAIRAPVSVALPLAQWLYDYLGMVPLAVDCPDADSYLFEELRRALAGMNCPRALTPDAFSEADCVFADGATMAGLSTGSSSRAGVEIALPSLGHVDIVPRCMLGANGALHILEWLFNALIRE